LWGWFLSLSRTAERMKASMDMMSKGINPRRQLDRLLAKADRLQVRGICVVRASVRVFVCMCMCARPWMRTLTRKPKRPCRLPRKLRKKRWRRSKRCSTASARKRTSSRRRPSYKQWRGTRIRSRPPCLFGTRRMRWLVVRQQGLCKEVSQGCRLKRTGKMTREGLGERWGTCGWQDTNGV